MKKVVFAIAALLATMQFALAQPRQVHRNIGLDSLMSIMHRVYGQRVYYVGGGSARNLNFTVNEKRPALMADIIKMLEESGYSVSEYDNALFVLSGVGLNSKLPADYFARKKEPAREEKAKDYIDALLNISNVATIGNKVYQIGDSSNVKSGEKVYLSGYVRDSRTGEPVVGVSIYENSSKYICKYRCIRFLQDASPCRQKGTGCYRLLSGGLKSASAGL